MRDAFSTTLVELAKADPKVLLITGDHGYALFDQFRRECPDQYINAGIAEQNMVGMAAGLARLGFRPFVYGLSAFVPVRVIEQIKLDVAHDNLPVVFLGDGAGFVYSHLGTSHQSTEDIAATRAIPNLVILSPADAHEMGECLEYSYLIKSPVYLRMGKSDRGDVSADAVEKVSLANAKIRKIRSGNDSLPALIATGSMVKTAVEIADAHGALEVWSVPSIKPLGTEDFQSFSANRRTLVTIEEHSVMGGLGSAVAEIYSSYGQGKVLRIGVEDRFSHACGSYAYLLQEHGLDYESIKQKVKKIVEPQ